MLPHGEQTPLINIGRKKERDTFLLNYQNPLIPDCKVGQSRDRN